MMTMGYSLTLTPEEAKDIVWGDVVASQAVSRHRWYTKRLIVFKRDDELLGFHYLDPASEDQEGQDLFEADPVPVFKVVAHEVTKIVYEAQ